MAAKTRNAWLICPGCTPYELTDGRFWMLRELEAEDWVPCVRMTETVPSPNWPVLGSMYNGTPAITVPSDSTRAACSVAEKPELLENATVTALPALMPVVSICSKVNGVGVVVEKPVIAIPADDGGGFSVMVAVPDADAPVMLVAVRVTVEVAAIVDGAVYVTPVVEEALSVPAPAPILQVTPALAGSFATVAANVC